MVILQKKFHRLNAKLAIIRGNHFIANKNPKTFNQEVDAFLKTI